MGFREEWAGADQEPKRILLPVRQLQVWIERNVLLILKDAPFDREDPQLVPAAGSCLTCPKRTGHNKLLFAGISEHSDVAANLCNRLLHKLPASGFNADSGRVFSDQVPVGSFRAHDYHGFLRGDLFFVEAPADSKRRRSCFCFRPFKSGRSLSTTSFRSSIEGISVRRGSGNCRVSRYGGTPIGFATSRKGVFDNRSATTLA